jgi:hypothetical protein
MPRKRKYKVSGDTKKVNFTTEGLFGPFTSSIYRGGKNSTNYLGFSTRPFKVLFRRKK